MNNCTCGVKFTGGLCSDWCDSKSIPVYDASGDSYVLGVTNFTLRNIEAAQDLVGITYPYEIVEIHVHPVIYHKALSCNLIDRYQDGLERIQGMLLKPLYSGLHLDMVFETIIKQGDKQVILRTRETL